MKTLTILGLCFFVSCGSQPPEPQNAFKRILPDTARSWSGRMTAETYHQTRSIEKKFSLASLWNGIRGKELRIWNLSGSYDPQVLLILNKSETGNWNLRVVNFYQTKRDSIYSDYTRLIRSSSVDSLNLDRCWNFASQSDLKEGDNYGCLDGGDVFMEIADTTRYRFMWYKCPDINNKKDSAFFLANELSRKISELAMQHSEL